MALSDGYHTTMAPPPTTDHVTYIFLPLSVHKHRVHDVDLFFTDENGDQSQNGLLVHHMLLVLFSLSLPNQLVNKAR